MTTAREHLAAGLRDGLGTGWTIHDTAKVPDRVTRPTVILARRLVEPLPEAPLGYRRHTFDVHLLTGLELDKADDALDETLDELLGVLDTLLIVRWTTAERAVFDQRWQGFTVAVQMHTTEEEEETP